MSDQIKSAAIIGTGNLAGHLALALRKAGITDLIILGRDLAKAEKLAQKTGARHDRFRPDNEAVSDIIFLAVPDEAINDVADQIKDNGQMVVHLSGTEGLSTLAGKFKHAGVFYPLQTFSPGSEPDWKQVPLCLECIHPADMARLKKLASALSDHIYELDSKQRRWAHLAAVISGNFTNYLYYISAQLLKSKDLPFDLLKPLIVETASKAVRMGPLAAQTGPAVREDIRTIENHLQEIGDDRDLQELYKLISHMIIQTHQK